MASDTPASADFIVVGGGVAGLVLARRLILAGRSVVVLEAADHLGGTVARHTVGGIELDAGAESFATRGGTVAKLATALGLGDEIVKPNPEGAWLQPASGPASRLPENTLLGIPGSPMASDVTAIIGEAAGLRAFSEALMPGVVGSKSATLGQLVRRRMGSAVLEQLVRPVVRGVHSADPDDLALDEVAPGLRGAMLETGSLARAVLALRANSARAGSAVAGIRGGVFRLVDALEHDLRRFGVPVHLNSRVTDLSPNGIRVGLDRLAGRVVVAAPDLVGGQVPPATRVILATLVVEQPLLDDAPRGTGVLVADGAAGIRARALTHSTAKWPWLAEDANGKHVVRLSYDTESFGADAQPLHEIARRDAAALLGVPIPASAVLDFARVEWYRPSRVTTSPSEIPLAGESIAGTGLASVVAYSDALAGTLLEDAEG